MITDVVVAILDREALADVLPAVHTNGLGHVARVLTVERGDLHGQLKRMGVPAEQAPEPVAESRTLLVLSAAARSPMAAALLLRSGASTAWIVTRNGEWKVFDDAVTHVSPTTTAMPVSPAQGLPSLPDVPGLHDVPPAGPAVTEPAAP
jgi:hypothetical protein